MCYNVKMVVHFVVAEAWSVVYKMIMMMTTDDFRNFLRPWTCCRGISVCLKLFVVTATKEGGTPVYITLITLGKLGKFFEACYM